MGWLLGWLVGVDGWRVGWLVGMDGWLVGWRLGWRLGWPVGWLDGNLLGEMVGGLVGLKVGFSVEIIVGFEVLALVIKVGFIVDWTGSELGDVVRVAVGLAGERKGKELKR